MSRVSLIQNTWINYIAQNQCTIVNYVRPTIDNGYGILIPDITQDAVPVTLGIGRVSRRSLPEPYVSGAKTTYDYKDVFYLIVAHDVVWLKKGITFVYGNNKFKTKLPENRYMFNAVVYQICDLEQVTSANIGDYHGS